MAVVEQKLSKVAHPLYGDADEDATNNCIRVYFCMSRFKQEQPAGLSSGEEALAGDQTTFPRPSPVERSSSEMNVVFGVVLRPDGRSPEVRLPPAHIIFHSKPKKISKNAENDSRRFCLFVYLDLQAAGTDIC